MNSIPKGTIKEYKLDSLELEEEMELLVYLPANFSPLNKHTVLIAQDGRDYFQLGRIGRVADQLANEGQIGNLIIVGIPYRDVHDRRSKYHPSGEKHTSYIRFLAHELVPFIDQEFPTYHMGLGRALIGDSLGATVSLLAAVQYPNTFGKCIMQSPLVNEAVEKAVKDFEHPQLLEIYHIVGKEETEVPTTDGGIANFIEPNRGLSNLFKEKGFSYFYDEFDGNHTWKYWQPDLKRALKHIF
ncbi:alpha/beta hydrolase [Peribacillus glennii]|uniref:Esterase family protein n=1 Tax=Peribacillus glennii TaxID=2303991 RepID=A0A372LJS5_9BACI|nr:alpha/beta hydrolase-fold protein [Peribacillus glennii]RFU66732.1 esterase family protein [Peribacillus glennii]